jgi:hypothetical protein
MRRLKANSQTLDLIQARLLGSPSERLQRLTALAARAPQFGPVFNELAQEYYRAIAAAVTNDVFVNEGAGRTPHPVQTGRAAGLLTLLH